MAGFGESLGWASNPIYKAFDSNRSAIVSGFAGLGGAAPGNIGGGFAQGFAQGMPLDERRADKLAEQTKLTEQGNVTRSWLEQQGFTDLVPLVDAGQADIAYSEALKRMQPGYGEIGGGADAPSNVREWEYYNQLTPEQQSQYLIMKRSNTPLNIGTGFVTQDPANPGTVIGAPIAIENREAAYETGYGGVEGKTDAENVALYESVSSKMPGLRTVVDQLAALSDTATYTHSGQAMDALKREFGLPVGQGAIDRTSYISIVDNQILPLLRDTFGAQFTVQEGESLRATLGDPNKSPEEKKAVLNAFIEQKYRNVEAMKRDIPGQGGSGNGWQVLGVE